MNWFIFLWWWIFIGLVVFVLGIIIDAIFFERKLSSKVDWVVFFVCVVLGPISAIIAIKSFINGIRLGIKGIRKRNGSKRNSKND